MYEATQQPVVSPDIVVSLFAVALGFAAAGLAIGSSACVSQASGCSKSGR